jgi:hypothetical protein
VPNPLTWLVKAAEPATGRHPSVADVGRHDRAMVLYTCTDGKALGGLPAPVAHPCGRAAKALDDAGHTYELKTVNGAC